MGRRRKCCICVFIFLHPSPALVRERTQDVQLFKDVSGDVVLNRTQLHFKERKMLMKLLMIDQRITQGGS